MSDDARERVRAARDAAREAARRARAEAAERRAAKHAARRGALRAGGNATVAERHFPGEGVTEISVEHTAGKLTVRPCAEGEEPVVISRGSKVAPDLEVAQSGAQVSIRVKLSAGRVFRRRQGADTELRIPATLGRFAIEQGAGRVDIQGIETQTFFLHVGAGDVSIHDCGGRLEVEVGAGKVSVREHRGTAVVDTGTGEVLVHFMRADAGNNNVSVGMGSAEMQLPRGVAVDARLNSGIGRVQIDYPVAGPGAPVEVRISAGIGKAVLREASASRGEAVAPEGDSGTARPQRETRATEKSAEAGELRILHLMQQGRITPKEAVDLLAALKGMPPPGEQDNGQD